MQRSALACPKRGKVHNVLSISTKGQGYFVGATMTFWNLRKSRETNMTVKQFPSQIKESINASIIWQKASSTQVIKKIVSKSMKTLVTCNGFLETKV